ncbi:polysaccharide biosynthesis/export family protein [Tundrisphaera sp. TA3]|uniref:polysaccharide biosynthesis/export family protein n=1 Tax=Tundrisphaera sp. TA3 TaxID=3435775 RepID=UPI003EBCDBC5
MIPPASRTRARRVAFLALASFGFASSLPGEEPAPQADAPAAPAEIKPLPPTPIPDDPPPHQGAMFDLPYVIEPPDIIVVEVLEALPGRPITGERLVRPDGTISLGFYGDVHVRGLTLPQAKAKVIAALNKHLTDEILGLAVLSEPEDEDDEPAPDRGKDRPRRRGKGKGKRRKAATAPPLKVQAVPPEESTKVSIDIDSYNSKVYYMEGEVATPGRLPCTGNETVLDAIHFAGGLGASHDPENIHLYRPARGAAPARIYRIDLMPILRGDAAQNYQIFPGDRIVVGRKKDPAPEAEAADR